MSIYIYLIIAIFIIYGVVYSLPISNQVRKKTFLILVGILLIFISALRGYSVGTDTAGYLRDYMTKRSASFGEVLTEWGNNLGYYWLSGLFIDAGLPIQIWFGFIALLYSSAMFFLIDRYSENPLLSVIMYLSVGTFAFSLAGLKQVFAMFFALLSFIALKKRKPIGFILAIFIGSFFHISILVFLFAYPFSYVKKVGNQVMISIFILLITFGSGLTVMQQVLDIVDVEHYYAYFTETAQYSLTGFFIQACIVVVSLIFCKEAVRKDETNQIMIPLVLLGLVGQSLASVVASAFRLSLYFIPFATILLPNCLRNQQNIGNRKTLEYGALLVFVAYFLYSVSGESSISPYVFFWNGV